MSKIKVGISACILKASRSEERIPVFNGRPLAYVEYGMPDWISRYGGIPLMLPPPLGFYDLKVGETIQDHPEATYILEIMSDMMDSIDCLVIHGGVDMAPESYGQTPLKPEWSGDWIRDQYELTLFKLCLEKNKPVVGICRGHQVINVALGGTLYQDTCTQKPDALVHRSQEMYEKLYQNTVLVEGSSLQKLYPGITACRTNTVHHQAIDQLAPSLVMDAYCPEDNVIEAVSASPEHYPNHYIRGIQWHPEFQRPESSDEERELLSPAPILEDLLKAAAERL